MLAFITFFSCISAFLFGYDLGLIGAALLHIKDDMGVGDGVAEIIVGAAKLGAVGGTFLGGALMLHYGRRPAIAIDSIFFLVGPIVMAGAWNVAGLVIGRAIVGIGIGISAVVVPAYLGEVAPARVRGRVVELYEVMLCLGMLCAALGDALLDSVPGNWRWMVGAPAIPALVMAFAALVLPESPRWLVTHGRMEEALAVMHKVHTSTALPLGVHASTAEVEAELMELWSNVEKDKEAATRRVAQFKSSQRQGNSLIGGGGAAGGGHSNSGVNGINSMNSKGALDETSVRDGRPPRPPSRGEGFEERMQAARSGSSASESGGGGFVDESEVLEIPARLPRIRTRSTDRLSSMVEGLETESLNSINATNYSNAPHMTQLAQQAQQQSGKLQLPQATSLSSSSLPRGTSVPPALSRSSIGSSNDGGMGSLTAAPRGRGFWATAWHMMKDILIVAQGPERAAFKMACILAFFNQAFASTAVINYAPSVLQQAGVESGAAAAYFTSIIGGAKLIGVTIAFFLVDSLGRRQLLIYGSIGCSISLAVLIPADWLDSHWLLVTGMSCFILCFSLSWAGVFWVLLSEMFSMAAKSPAVAAATAVLFLTGAIADLLFLTIHTVLGPFAFLLYALVAVAAAIYVVIAVPETKGRTLQEVQDLLAGRGGGSRARRGGEGEGLIPDGAAPSVLVGAGAVELPQQGFGRMM